MKPAAFDYRAASTVEGALGELAQHGNDIRILAGGQSLGPLLNLRLARPAVVLDINRVTSLDHISIGRDGQLTIGAMARQRAVEVDGSVAAAWPILVEAIRDIGHRAIRNRGTIGGSVSHADPAAELPAVLTAIDAVFEVGSPGGGRQIEAGDFFLGPFQTALRPDEMLLSVTVPPTNRGTRQAWLEYARRHGDFGLVGVAAVLQQGDDGVVEHARVIVSGADWTPWEAEAAQMLVGMRPTADTLTEVGISAAEASDPPDDIHASAEHRRRLIAALTTRALQRCAGAGGPS